MRSDLPADTEGPGVTTIHGTSVADPFRGLEDAESAATRDWLSRRDREFRAAVAAWPAREPLARDIRGLCRHDDYALPRRRGATLFTAHRPPQAQHPRVVALTDGEWRTLFDPMTLNPAGTTTLDAWEASPQGRYLAVQTSRDGTEIGRLAVLSCATGELLDEVHGVRYSHVAWLADPEWGAGVAFYYVRRDVAGPDARRGVWLRRPDSGGADALVHPCAGPHTVAGVDIQAGRWLLVRESHGTGHREDLWLADLETSPADRPRLQPVHEGIAAESEAQIGPDGLLYLRTSAGAPERRLCRADPRRPDEWTELDRPRPGGTLDALAVVGTGAAPWIVRSETRLGTSTLLAHPAADPAAASTVALPGPGMVTGIRAEPAGPDDAGPRLAYLGFASVTEPHRVLVYRQGAERPDAWPSSAAAAAARPPAQRRLHWARSADGTRVPVTVFSLEGFSGERPTILHAYGAYGRSRQFGFSATVLAWLRAGGRYAVAHVRGGGDLGADWHTGGARRNKYASVADLAAAARTVVEAGYCTTGQLCASAGSAGGLVVLRAAVAHPELFAAVIAHAPLADMVRFERLGMGGLWTREFGTVGDPADFAALLHVSPYHAALADTGPRRYPAVLLTGFHGDTRTGAAHARKMCAALRARARAPQRILLRYEFGVGHGPRALDRAIALAADCHAFAAAMTGMTERPPPPGELTCEEQKAR